MHNFLFSKLCRYSTALALSMIDVFQPDVLVLAACLGMVVGLWLWLCASCVPANFYSTGNILLMSIVTPYRASRRQCEQAAYSEGRVARRLHLSVAELAKDIGKFQSLAPRPKLRVLHREMPLPVDCWIVVLSLSRHPVCKSL